MSATSDVSSEGAGAATAPPGIAAMDAGAEQLLAAVPLFARLSHRHLHRVARLAQCARFAPGQRIVLEGSTCEAFYVVLEGEAEVLAPGREPLVLGPGEVFGELGLLDGGRRSATVAARTELLTVRVPRPAFRQLLEREPTITIALLEELAGRLRDVAEARAES